ncbi:hypothetical protein [Paludibacter propionicigenes]|uniref:hypothetical protein n=1 Tax=Paludibacter propionicigenes TaxID=185300 RepID=UPI0011D0FDB0|nr:hypothetical protein [Paludibacter propionicigenes]
MGRNKFPQQRLSRCWGNRRHRESIVLVNIRDDCYPIFSSAASTLQSSSHRTVALTVRVLKPTLLIVTSQP